MKSNEMYTRVASVKDREELEKLAPGVKGMPTPFYIKTTDKPFLVYMRRAGNASDTYDRVEFSIFLEIIKKDMKRFNIETFGVVEEQIEDIPHPNIDHDPSLNIHPNDESFRNPIFGNPMFGQPPFTPPPFTGPRPKSNQQYRDNQQYKGYSDNIISDSLSVSLRLNNVAEILNLIKNSEGYSDIITAALETVVVFPAVLVLDVNNLTLRATNVDISAMLESCSGLYRDSGSRSNKCNRDKEFKTFISLLDAASKKEER